MKKLIATVLTTVFFGSFLVKAQSSTNNGIPGTTNPTTTPANISQLEVNGRSFTQNSQNSPTGVQITGSFDPTARWNTMGNIPATTQTLNGFRTQTDGRGLAWGHSVPNSGTVSNGFIEWIGNNGVTPVVDPGSLEFRYALSSTGAAAARVPIFTMAPAFTTGGGSTIPAFNYAEVDALVGQLQSGSFGSFGGGDTWSATGQINTGSFTTYGSRHQYKNVSAILGNIEDNGTNKIKTVLDFGSTLPAISTSQTGIFQFRTFTNPTSSSSIKNVWQSSNNYGNVVFGRQDYGSVTSSNFYVSVFDGVASAASSTALNFVDKAGLYVTGDGLDQNNGGNQLNSYAAVVGDVSGVSLVGGAGTKYGILGIADGSYTSGNSFARIAGCFIGDILHTGNITFVSDQKFKKDIQKEENIMPRLMQLQPKNYLFDVEKNKKMAFSDKLQHGLISQEVEKVFPELVVDGFAPNTSSNKNEDGRPVAYKGLNYIGLIPMLLKGIQEQQVQINELKSKLETTTSNTLVVNDKNSLPAEIQNKAFALSQNVPNPFSENTTISYTMPASASKAILAVFDLNGKMLLQYNLQQGKNTIVVKGNTLSAGMYLYSLIADGQEVLSKRMVLTK